MEAHIDDLKRLKCAGFLTEFAIDKVTDLLFQTLDVTDRLLQSWMGWDYRPYYDIKVRSVSLCLKGLCNVPALVIQTCTSPTLLLYP